VSQRSQPRSAFSIVLVGSILLHIGLALTAKLVPKPDRSQNVSIAVLGEEEAEPEPPKPPPPPPPPPPPEPPKPERVRPTTPPKPVEAETPPDEPPPEAKPKRDLGEKFEGFEDLGLTLDGGGGEGGIAVPPPSAKGTDPRPQRAAKPRPEKPPEKKTLETKRADTCNDETKPKPKTQVAAKYPDEARKAEVEGRVKVKITIDENGKVVDAKIVKGLGFGLDEAAIAAYQQWTFEPATRCGKPVPTTITVAMRFGLG
jgi:periplasmic protein TonB